MRLNRQRRTAVVLFGLGGLAVIVAGVALGPWANREPVYQGKPVSVWFREYAFASNAPVGPGQIVSARIQPDGRMVLTQIIGGKQVTVTGPTNLAAQGAWLSQQMSAPRLPPRDPAWDALRALGTNAVPHLVRQLRGIPFEATYARILTNLPVLLQKKLPSPQANRYRRIQALDALGKLGDSAKEATPAVLALLGQRDQFLRFTVLETLRNLHVDRRSITLALLQLGAKGRYEDVLEIAGSTGWEGADMARLLGMILKSPDPALRRQAMTLFERSGTAAAPELESIVLALRDSDPEVRYLAARTLEAIGDNSGQVVTALQTALNDSNRMVQTVARRTLLKIAPETLSQDSADKVAAP